MGTMMRPTKAALVAASMRYTGDDDRVWGNIAGAVEAEQERRAFASDPDFQELKRARLLDGVGYVTDFDQDMAFGPVDWDAEDLRDEPEDLRDEPEF